MSALSVKLVTSSSTGQPIIDSKQRTVDIYFNITVAAGNYTAGGDTLDLTQLFVLAAGYPGLNVMSGALPINVVIKSFKAGGVSGYEYRFTPGTTLANGTMQTLWTQSSDDSPLEEIDGAYPAGVTGDTILAVATFPRI